MPLSSFPSKSIMPYEFWLKFGRGVETFEGLGGRRLRAKPNERCLYLHIKQWKD